MRGLMLGRIASKVKMMAIRSGVQALACSNYSNLNSII